MGDLLAGQPLLGAALPLIDFFIVNVALPTIDRDLNAGPALLELVVAGYGLAYAVLLVLGGRLGDMVGRRRLFLVGMAAFGITSLACGLAPDAWTLVGARVAQGAAAALMLPQVLATIQAATRGPRRARAMSLYGATAGLSMVAGQILGGVLVAAAPMSSVFGESAGWRSVFLVNVPVAVVGLILAARAVPETRSDRPAPVDVPGTLLLALSLVTLLAPLTEGRAAGWPLWTWVRSLALAPMALAFFAASLAGPRLIRRYGTRIVTAGGLIQAVGVVVLVLTVHFAWQGLGLWGLQLPVLFRIVLSDVPPEKAGVGGGVMTTTQQAALALGVATLGTLFLALVPGPGMREALIVRLLVQLAAVALTVGLSLRLPRTVA
ncbi:MFS transporter [Streptomyces microflavus]|uniref:MFS transporter n=1 Tax=Streptomyces microflavus TaxID=1919 RepID=UPI00381A8145